MTNNRKEWAHKMEKMPDVTGKIVDSVFIETTKNGYNSQEILYISVSGVVHRFFVEGDCCSRSWIEHIHGIEAIIGHPILSWFPEYLGGDDISSQTDRDNGDQTLQYIYTITTTAGRFDIDMRNSSNGYYEGNLEYAGTVDDVPETAKRVTEDY